jgi:hypothetical protein
MMEYKTKEPVFDEAGYILTFNSILNNLKEIPEIIGKKFSKDHNSNLYHARNLNSIENNNFEEFIFRKLVESLFNTMEILYINLHEDSLIDNEFTDFSIIYRIAQHIFKKSKSEILKEEAELFFNMCDEFIKIMRIREKLIPKNIKFLGSWNDKSKDKYLEEYENFEETFHDYHEIFFTKFHTPNKNNEKIINDLFNILRE